MTEATTKAEDASSPDGEESMSIQEIQHALIDARKSDVFRRLQLYYERRSIFDIIGRSRKEDTHTRILAWLFDPSESHGLGTQPIRRLLEAVAVAGSKGMQKAFNEVLPPDVLNRIVAGSYRIPSAELTAEKSVGPGRIDLFIEGKIGFPSGDGRHDGGYSLEKTNPFRLLIENKVNAAETEGQTIRYYEWLAEGREEGTLDIPLFLTPISTLELDRLEEPECDCKHFVQINYQYLVDYVLAPCLQQDLGPQARWILEEYTRTLSTSISTEDNAMALGSEERDLLHSFLQENEPLFKAIMLAISQDETRDKEERDAAEQYHKASKDRANVKILVDGEEKRHLKYKGHTGFAVAQVLQEIGLLDAVFDGLRTDKTTRRQLLKRKEEMNEDEISNRYHVSEERKIVHGGDVYYASSQWKEGDVPNFQKEIQKLLPEDAPKIELRRVQPE
jgi:hypothetical protein